MATIFLLAFVSTDDFEFEGSKLPVLHNLVKLVYTYFFVIFTEKGQEE